MRDRLHEEQPEAVEVEHLLGDDEAADEERELERDHREHRQHRVLQRVPRQHQPLHQPLGPRRADVVLAQHLEHRRARHAHANGRIAIADRERWPDELLDVLPRVDPERRVDHRRQPVEHDQEQQDEHDAEPEGRRGEAGDGEDAHGVVDPRVLLERGQHAERDRERDRHHRRHDRDLQ